MTVCTLIGDRNTPESMRENIRQALYLLVRNLKVDFFYVGADGNFDEIVEEELYLLCSEYPHIGYNVIICAEPNKEYDPIEIYKRNLCPIFPFKESSKDSIVDKIRRWMIKESEIVILHSSNNSAEINELRKYAESEDKTIINLCCKG